MILLLDGILIHQIEFEFDLNNKNISITAMNNCLFYQLSTKLCVSLFKYILQPHLNITSNLSVHEMSHQVQYFSQLVIIQELLYSSDNLYMNNINETIRNHKQVLCISHYDESLTWLNGADTPFVLVSKTIYSPPHLLTVPVNAGNEVSSYLLYIITFYDMLPEYTLFLHGHEHAW